VGGWMGGSSLDLLDRFQMQLAGPVSRAKNPRFSLFLDTKRATERQGRRHTHTRERERDLEREERWRDLGGSVCLPPVSLSSSCIFATIFLRLIWFFWWGFVVVFWLVFLCSGFGICLLSIPFEECPIGWLLLLPDVVAKLVFEVVFVKFGELWVRGLWSLLCHCMDW
jgi:hypothetical protein